MGNNYRFVLFIFTAFIAFSKANSQGGVTIGSSSAPNSSAVLDLQSTTKGLLPPRMSAIQRKAIASPAPGLVVFDTDANQLYLYDGSTWQPLSAGGNTNNLTPSQQSLIASEQIETGFFGVDVSMSDSFAAVGAMRYDSGSVVQSGAAYVYKKGSSGGWKQVAKLSPPDAHVTEYFGASVAIAGNYVVVGAPLYVAPGPVYSAGKIYIYVKGAGDTWTLQASFTRPGGSIGFTSFGFDVAISTASTFGPVVVAGAPYDPAGGSNRGAAYTFRLTNGTWAFQQQLLPNPSDLSDGDAFGWAVSIDGDYCAAGAPYQYNSTSNLYQAGAAYVFVFGGGQWFAQQKLQGVTASAQMGFSLCLKDNMLAAGAPFAPVGSGLSPAVRLYQRTGTTWGALPPAYLIPYQFSGDKDYFGVSVAIENNVLMVGMPNSFRTSVNYNASSSKGYVVVFKYLPLLGTYAVSKLINDDDPLGSPSTTNYFGNAVSLKNGNYIIGIPGKTVGDKLEVGSVAFGYLP